MTTRLVINTIYTPGSVQYLYMFVLSWLKWSNCLFRLVVNGCTLEEVRILQEFCTKDSRLDLLILSSTKVMSHGEILNSLQALEQSEYFCFMDPDILVTGEFLQNVVPALGRYAGVFLGAPLWNDNGDQILPENEQNIWGRYNRTPENVCLGSTYFAIYNNTALSKMICSTGLSFDKYVWEDIPECCQRQIAQMGLQRKFYDTGKVLNLLLQAQGELLTFKEMPYLQHIGGINQYLLRKIRRPMSRRLKKDLRQLPEAQAAPLLTKLDNVQDLKTLGMMLTDEEWEVFLPVFVPLEVQKLRLSIARYIIRLLHALVEYQPLPAPPKADVPEFKEKIQDITSNIVRLYKEYKGYVAISSE